jgi:hypothetical protein
LVVAWLLPAAKADAGPWVRPPWSAYVKFATSFYSAEESFSRGVMARGLTYDAITYDLYAEIGLPWRLTAVVDLPYVTAANTSAATDVEYQNNTFGDGRFELHYGLLDAPVALAFGVETKVPLYQLVSDQAEGSLVEVDSRLWPAASFPEVGDGNVDVTPKALAGLGFHLGPLPGWATTELGYRIRTEGFLDGPYFAASLGLFVWPQHIALGAYTNGIFALGEDEDPNVVATQELVYTQGYVHVTGAPWVPDMGLTVAYGGVVYAENTSKGQELSLALSYNF